MRFMELGKMTLGSIFKKPETIMYPVQKKEPPAGLKGAIHNDVSNCILCGACARNCPADALVVDRNERTWQIDHFRCIMCNMCVRSCPKKCLEMTTVFPAVSTKHEPEVLNVPEQPKPASKPKPAAAPAAKPAE